MTINIETYVLGPIHNNGYLVSDPETGLAVVIDPPINSERILDDILKRKLSLSAIWLTHGHFDHFAGASILSRSFQPHTMIGLHPEDMEMQASGGGAQAFGFDIDYRFIPKIKFFHGQILTMGNSTFEIRHTPGHSPGHVIIYCSGVGAAFCGDLIFRKSVGRTDLTGGDLTALLASIHDQVFTLPPETRLLPGHGPETTVFREMQDNPFLG